MKFKIILLLTILGELMANSLPKHYIKVLENNLTVCAIPLDNNSGVITTDVFYKVGSRNEMMGKSGLAHMLEHMNFKSTKNLKEGQFDKIVKEHGGLNNASTGFDYTHYYIKSASKYMGTSMGLFAELMENLNLKDEEFQKERNVVAEERRWRTDNNPIGYLYFRLFNEHYTSHSYHWTPIGFIEDILHWNINDLREFHSKFYKPENAILVVAGDISPEAVFKEAKEKFGKISNDRNEFKSSIFGTFVPREPQRDGSKRAIIHKKGNSVETLAIAYSIPAFDDKDQLALSVITDILSNGKSSRLYKDMVEEKQMASTIYGYNMELKDPGVFIFFAMATPKYSAEDLEKEILLQIEELKSGKVTQEEIEKVKLNTKVDFLRELDSSSSIATLFGGYLARGNLQPLLEYEDNLDKITIED
ncbi:MAG TPA: insulinase family protein, partial [Nitratifractor sp.]|nr:insulinase family protein [Nitratifractor sp.]